MTHILDTETYFGSAKRNVNHAPTSTSSSVTIMRSPLRSPLTTVLRQRLVGRIVRCTAATGPATVAKRELSTASPTLKLLENSYTTDDWTNVPASIIAALPRRLHLETSHPLSLTRQLITSRFAAPTYKHYSDLPPIVTTHQNFDSLGFSQEHPGRSKTDTYYINASTCLRTHTSAHQADIFRADASEGYTVTADVYRRDAIDRSHYPVFHQMEGARIWNRRNSGGGSLAPSIWADVERLPKHDLVVEDPNSTIQNERNPLQKSHDAGETEAMAAHLKRSLEDVVETIFSAARAANPSTEPEAPLRVRWVEAYFPFTSPSWELEVYWQDQWLELLGSGIVSQPILDGAGVSEKIGWAFGLGLERIAMLLYGIPDIRLFWSKDERFLSQFQAGQPPRRFVPFSKHPACWKDVAFWLPQGIENTGAVADGAKAAGGPMSSHTLQKSAMFHENDMMEMVREVAGDLAEDVKLVDEFEHPKTGRRSMCYRINYRSLERTLKNEEANTLHEAVRIALKDRLGVILR